MPGFFVITYFVYIERVKLYTSNRAGGGHTNFNIPVTPAH